jgi:2-polyprenyl-3-methyl-5-hydroxy-6-metoxy-1,4-benzoquinol methylase
MEDAKQLNECLCCGRERLKLVLDLNEQPLANSFKKTAEEAEPYFPLRLNICEDCTHLQLSHAVNPDLLFKNYLYVSGTSQTLRDYFDWFAKRTLEYFEIPPQTVLDIACNDGSQLNSFKTVGLKTYGIDPAENLHVLSNANHEVVCDYFKEKYVYHYKMKQLDIITAQNVFAHNDYPLDFLLQCKEIMHDKSRLFIQTSQADMIENNEFDTIYHEHLSFFNSSSMMALAERAGLHIIDIQKTPIHGNSYMFVFSKNPGARLSVQHQLDLERDEGLQDMNTYLVYAEKCHQVIKDLNDVISDYRSQGYVIVGYGAAAKGMTLLNFGQTTLDYIIDDNTLKQGLYTPGMNIPIVSIDILEELREKQIAFVPLAWNFFKEIKGKIKTNRDVASDVYIKYFPIIKIE